MEKFDLSAIRGKWLSQCGSCDAGLPMNCTCPNDDPRSVILTLVNHLEDLYSNFDLLTCSTMGEAMDRLEALTVAEARIVETLELLNDREVEWCCSCPADLHRVEKVLNPDA